MNPPELSEWLYSYGMMAVYIVPIWHAWQVRHPVEILDPDVVGGSKLFEYEVKRQKYAALKNAVRWTSHEFEIARWSVYKTCLFPTESLEFAQGHFADLTFDKKFDLKHLRNFF